MYNDYKISAHLVIFRYWRCSCWFVYWLSMCHCIYIYNSKKKEQVVAVTILPFFYILCVGSAFAMDDPPENQQEQGYQSQHRESTVSESQSSLNEISPHSCPQCPCCSLPCLGIAAGALIGATSSGVLGYFLAPQICGCLGKQGALIVGTGGCTACGGGLGAGLCQARTGVQCCNHGTPSPEQGGESSSTSSSLPITTQPGPINPYGTIPGPSQEHSTSFISGYNGLGQISSLQGMQSVLLGVSEQVSTMLKTITLKMHETHTEEPTSIQSGRTSFRKSVLSMLPTNGASSSVQTFFPCKLLVFSDTYTSNLECKTGSSHVGIVTNLSTDWTIGLTMHSNKGRKQESSGMKVGTSIGSVQAQLNTTGLLAAIVSNSGKPGITTTISTCYSWGTIKNSRSVSDHERDLCTKGNADISMSGGLVQVGYNVFLSKGVVVIPYVEYLMSYVQWRPYSEHSGLNPCTISKNSEKFHETSIGFRNQWTVTNRSSLQLWVAGVSGCRKQSHLHSRLLQARIGQYEAWVPTRKNQYKRTDIGFAYSINLMDTVQIELNGKTCFEKGETLKTQQIGCTLQYVY